jgi:hypothetical protein
VSGEKARAPGRGQAGPSFVLFVERAQGEGVGEVEAEVEAEVGHREAQPRATSLTSPPPPTFLGS